MPKSRHLLVGLDWEEEEEEEEEGAVDWAGDESLVVVVEKRGVESVRCGKEYAGEEGGDAVADERDVDEERGSKDNGVVCCRRR